MKDPQMSDQLLLDQPQLMGVESLELDTVNLRMVASHPARQAVRGRPAAAADGGPRRWPGPASPADRPRSTSPVGQPRGPRGAEALISQRAQR